MTVGDSIARYCVVCKAKPGAPCTNTIKPGEPLPGRTYHYARTQTGLIQGEAAGA